MEKVFNSSGSGGKANFGWLNTNYSFHYVNYLNTNNMQPGLFKVLNDDVNTPGREFITHPLEIMKIIRLPLPGNLKHLNSNSYQAVAMSNSFGIHLQIYLHFGHIYAEISANII